MLQEVTKLVYEVTEDDVTRAKNQLKAMQLFGIGNTGGEPCWPVIVFVINADLHAMRSMPVVTASVCPSTVCTSTDVLNATGAAEELGRHQLAYGRRVSKAELFARIDAVDAATVKAVAERFLYDQDVAIAAYGDTLGLPDYNWFRRRTFWLRY